MPNYKMKFSLALSIIFSLVLPAFPTEIISHRGYSAIAPENTVAAFKLAWENGTDACENDIYLTSDDKIAVIHDKDTKRTTGVSLPVAKSTLAELQALDSGSFRGAKWKGERLPSLQEALATMPKGKQRFFVEIKCGPEVVPAVKELFESMRERASQLVIISFNHDAAVKTKEAMPWVKVYFLASGKTKDKQPRTDLAKLIEDARANHFDGLDLGSDWPWSAAMVKQIHDAGLQAYVWTVDDPAKARQLAGFGVDGITTNDPVVIRTTLEKK